MAKKMLIDATHAEETRVVVVDGNKVEEFDFESENKRQLAGNIYLAKVTRVEPSLQAAFVDYGGNRHGFLAFSEIHPDYYQIPVADREALIEEERAYAEQQKAEEEEEEKKPRRRRSRSRAASAKSKDAKATKEVEASSEEAAPVVDQAAPEGDTAIAGMETIDLTEGDSDAVDTGAVDATEVGAADVAEAGEGLSPMETVAETPVEEPAEEAAEDAPAEVAEEAVAEEAPAVEAATEEVAAEETVAEEAPTEDAPAEDAASEEAATEEAPAEEVKAEEAKADDAAVEADASEETSEDTSEEASEDNGDESSDDSDDEDEDGDDKLDATDKDDSIESVADEDDSADIRPRRKPRPRRYKIQEVIKVRQILLVQVVKEERGNKGAALTTYLSLAGRYCVLMPNTARGGGISRKITNAADRKKLKEIANEMDVPKGAGLIVRTAGAKRTKAEIKRDYEYLQRMWEQIRELTLQSIAPAKIYEEGDLIKRSIRDLYNREIDEVLVEGERGYRIAKDFMKMIMPSHAKNVKNYQDQLPLFARYQVESYLGGMFNPTVQLKSGGYIVIGVTEALVAVDVNSGRATKEGSIEETALKTNLEAAEEVARQLRLRDLAGLIVIDFIDMDERRNNNAVEKRLKDKLKSDRARIQIGRISGFGLLEMSRQRLRPGMIEATTQPCPACHGTGLIRSDDNLALSILRQIEEEGTRGRSREVLVKCPVGIANFIMNQKREHVAQIEARYGLSVRVEGDPMLVSPDFTIEKFKTATRVVAEPAAPVVSVDASLMEQIDEEAEAEEAQEAAEVAAVEAEGDEEQKPKKRRRRRRRRKGGADRPEGETVEGDAQEVAGAEAGADAEASEAAEGDAPAAEGDDDKPVEKKRRRRRSRRKKSDQPTDAETADAEAAEAGAEGEAVEAEAEAPAEAPVEAVAEETAAAEVPEAEATAPVAEAPAEEATAEDVKVEDAPAAEEAPAESVAVESVAAEAPAEAEPEVAAEPEPVAETAVAEPVAEVAVAPAVEEPAAPPKPKRRGWWSI
ncbi:Rne/Rng family ribonuclease [Thalassovita mediterranea]|uniref:Ribonuclease E n=1 Tax=Thalassovita mediterranea TaxID=340021 RepID=A0A0P1GMA6_9RHOB|nr:ribonuclease E/G [Thalassovita mediterranea]CUH83350.1 Ribonuclease E [Thalassovita mediterranea]SIS34044.1 RNAse E [Thalassovita mediterranea]